MVVGVTSRDSDQAIAFNRCGMFKRARKVRYVEWIENISSNLVTVASKFPIDEVAPT